MAANRLPDPPLLVITDRRQARLPLEEVAEAAFAAGCRWLSVREKDLPPAERLRLLQRIASVGSRYRATVGVHGDLAAAMAVPRVALHLQSGGDPMTARRLLGPGRLLGLSAHGGDALAGHAAAGADYVTLSPINLSASKPGYGPALGMAELARIIAAGAPRVIALGGIGPADVTACLKAGAAGVATMGGVMTADDIAGAVAALLQPLQPWRGSR